MVLGEIYINLLLKIFYINCIIIVSKFTRIVYQSKLKCQEISQLTECGSVLFKVTIEFLPDFEAFYKSQITITKVKKGLCSDNLN